MDRDGASFDACRWRIGWAHAKSHALVSKWRDFHNTNPHSIRFYHEGEGKISVILVCGFKAIPAQFSLEFGEILYHIRAALEGAVYVCATEKLTQITPEREKLIHFPLYKKPDDFNRAITQIGGINDIRRTILESVQPYKIPTDPAAARLSPARAINILNAWAKIDRHRYLHTVGTNVSDKAIVYVPPTGYTITQYRSLPPTELKLETKIAEFVLVGPSAMVQIQTEGEITINVTIDEAPPPLDESDIGFNRVNDIIQASTMIINALEANGRKPPTYVIAPVPVPRAVTTD